MAERLAVAVDTALPDSPVETAFRPSPDNPITAHMPKSMSPEKAALAAMFDSIQMPAPTSPTKSPRKPALLTHSTKPMLTRGPLVPGRLLATTTSPSRSRQRGVVQGNASPSAKLSDLSLLPDTTNAHEWFVNDRTLGSDSFLAAGVADVTINDSFDVSRARKMYSTRATTAAQGAKAANGLSRLGVGRVVKNAAGDDTIELSSFAAGSASMMDNLLDESGQNTLLFGSSFSVNKEKRSARRSDGSSNGSSSSGEDEMQVKLWNGKLHSSTQPLVTPRQIKQPVPTATSATVRPTARQLTLSRTLSIGKTSSSTCLAARSEQITPAASRLLQSRGATVTPAVSRGTSTDEAGDDGKTPMRQRRKSTFTASRPPVSGHVSRRESLLAAPPVPQVAPKTPGRVGAIKAKIDSPRSATKTPIAKSLPARTLPRPRASLTSATTPRLATASLPVSTSATSLSSLTKGAGGASAGSIPRPRASLVGRTMLPGQGASVNTEPATRSSARLPRSSVLARPPSSSQACTSEVRPSTTATVAEPRKFVSRASVGQRHAPLTAQSLQTPHRSISVSAARTASSDKVLDEISNVPSAVAPIAAGASKIARPRISIAGRSNSFGFQSRLSQVPVTAQASANNQLQ